VSPRDDANTHNKSKFANSVEHPVFRVIAILATITTVSLGVRTWWFSDANGANQSGAVPSTAVPSTAVPRLPRHPRQPCGQYRRFGVGDGKLATTSPADTPHQWSRLETVERWRVDCSVHRDPSDRGHRNQCGRLQRRDRNGYLGGIENSTC